ncbi:hypothetical protein C3Y91_31180 [Rhizobium sp. UPM1133]|nr:hypothetical protein [Rhizobium ruizarguesonis]
MSCGRGRYFRIEETDFKKRYVSLKFSRPGSPDAHAVFFEWDSSGFVSAVEFQDAADSYSQEDYEMAAAVGQCWSDGWENPLDYGSIVVFHRLVIPHPMPGFWETMRAAIKREFSRRSAMMVLKAFPLEWENRFQDPGAPGKEAFERRLKAMTKHYQRNLGVSPMPVSPSLGEWFWLPIRFDEDPQEGPEMRSAYRV